MEMKRALLFLLVLTAAVACQKPVAEPSEFLKACNSEEGGIVLSHVEGGLKFSLAYRPSEYFSAQRMVRAQVSEFPSIDSRTHSDFDPNFYFMYSVRLDRDAGNSVPIAQHLEYLVRALEKDQQALSARVVILTRNGDSLFCSLAQIQPDWASHAGFDLMLAFRKRSGAENLDDLRRMVFRDLGDQGGLVEFGLEPMRPKYRFAYRKEG